MPIVRNGDSVCVEYDIPQDIDEKIPEHFYHAMAGELLSVFGPQLFEKVAWYEYDENGDEIPDSRDESEDYYDLDSSTGGWYEAMKATCEKLDMMWLIDYWKTLEYYDSDIFDGIIESRIIEKVIEAEHSNCNAYYKYLVQKGSNQHGNRR